MVESSEKEGSSRRTRMVKRDPFLFPVGEEGDDQNDGYERKRLCTTSVSAPSSSLPSRQWVLLHRGSAPCNGVVEDATIGSQTLVLREHLGDASAMVDSLTQGIDSWTLISSSSDRSSRSHKEQIRTSQRAIRKALLSNKQKT